MQSKNTILKAIHNKMLSGVMLLELRMQSKNTILKAIHNGGRVYDTRARTANAK